jgi:hypothetical protein
LVGVYTGEGGVRKAVYSRQPTAGSLLGAGGCNHPNLLAGAIRFACESLEMEGGFVSSPVLAH